MATKARKSWWTQPVDWDTVCRRARGRSRINAWRRHLATLRRREVLNLLQRFGWKYGVQALIAAHLGVSESTVSRDIKAIFPLMRTCPHGHQLMPRAWWAHDPAERP
jgi:DNA-binding NarL/FixJ family response regulator